MEVGLDNNELKHLCQILKSGEYDGEDLTHARLAIKELIELREWREKVFIVEPNIDSYIGHVAGLFT